MSTTMYMYRSVRVHYIEICSYLPYMVIVCIDENVFYKPIVVYLHYDLSFCYNRIYITYIYFIPLILSIT